MTFRLNIVLSQENIWDYEEFRSECIVQAIEPIAIGEWSTKVGNLQAAMYKWPDLEPFAAYLELLKIMYYGLPEDKPYQSVNIVDFDRQGCSGCGGGRVL